MKPWHGNDDWDNNDKWWVLCTTCNMSPNTIKLETTTFASISSHKHYTLYIFCRARAALERTWATASLFVFSGWLTTLVHEPWHHGIMAPWHDGSLSLSMNHHRIMTLHHIRPFSLPRSMKIIWTPFQNNQNPKSNSWCPSERSPLETSDVV